MRNKTRLFLTSLTAASLAACASPTIAPDSTVLPVDVLLRAEPLTGPADVAALNEIDVLVLDQEMLSFLDEHVGRKHSRKRKVNELLWAIMNESGARIDYDVATRTAQETFEARLGNCLSFTNLFVAMAREVGLKVSYQEVSIPPNWSVEGDTYVLSRHVNAIVDMGNDASTEVDFYIDDFQSSLDGKLISDERALAYYYSNIGVEYLQRNEPLEALRYFRKALDSDRELAQVWSNLGVLFSKAGHFGYAEAAYVQALKYNPQELVAMSNLGQLYERQGQTELAAWYKERSDRHRMRNPYYRYHLARSAFLAEDYEAAIGHLRYSVRNQRDEGAFHMLMGLSYLQVGNESAARRWLKRAERVNEDDGMKRIINNKLEMLLSHRQ